MLFIFLMLGQSTHRRKRRHRNIGLAITQARGRNTAKPYFWQEGPPLKSACAVYRLSILYYHARRPVNGLPITRAERSGVGFIGALYGPRLRVRHSKKFLHWNGPVVIRRPN
jgi:hypothetical protein